jgi:hypothetical protein
VSLAQSTDFDVLFCVRLFSVPNVRVPQGRSIRTAMSCVVAVGRVGEGELHVLAPGVLRVR